MISYLNGKIIHKTRNAVILRVGQVGYKVFLNEKFFQKLNLNDEVEVYTHTYVREDALDLYGFETLEQLSLFETLLAISGIGPKSALSATSIAGVGEFREYVSRGDSTLLQQVSGIGKKTAERIVIELRDKIGFLPSGEEKTESEGQAGSAESITGDEIDALMALGYSMTQSRDALKKVNPEVKESGQRIKEALRNIE